MGMPDRERWKRLNPLLDELLDLDAAARQRRLAELRERDASVATDLAKMLGFAVDADQTRFLASNAQDEGVAAAPLIGTQIGAYVIEALLGQGGTGGVWRARRTDGRFEGAVAIKLLHLSLLGRMGAARFEREGAILARLTHPHIARLLDAGVTAGGQPYLVLELVEGERIDRYCDGRQLDIARRLALYDDVLSAVAHAHNHLVIHRDIKPNNILVTAEGDVKLLDFGIAKLLDDADGALVTADGQRALTPEYAAPEQLQNAPVTTAADVYALGVLLYHLLVGRHPTAFDATSPAEVIRATLDTGPLRLTSALAASDAGPGTSCGVAAARGTTLARLRRQLEGDLENIVALTLRKLPAERYQTVGALAEDLRRYRQDEPVSARPDSLAYRSMKFVRRNRSIVATGLLAALAVMGGLAGTITQAQRAGAQAAQAHRERDNALRQLAYAASANQFIGFLLEEGSDKPFTTSDLLARGEALVERQFGADPAQQASLNLTLGSLYFQAGQESKGTELLVRAQNVARHAGDPSLQAEIECELANQHSWSGSFEKARSTMDSAIASLRAAPELDRDTVAKCLFGRSQVNGISGNIQASLDDAQLALDTLGTPRSHQRLTAIYIRAALAGAQSRMGEPAKAIGAYEQAIAELAAMGRGNTRSMAVMYINLGANLAGSGQTLRAVETYERALGLLRGFGDTSTITTLESNYAGLLVELGRPREAMPLIEHARAKASADGNVLQASIVALRGAPAWCAVQDLARCAELLAAARAGFTGVLAAGHSRFGILMMAQAKLDVARADLPQARADLKQAVALFEAAGDKTSAGTRALTLLARTEQQLGELDAANADATRAVLQARDAMTGFAHSEWLGNALVAQGMVQRARGAPRRRAGVVGRRADRAARDRRRVGAGDGRGQASARRLMTRVRPDQKDSTRLELRTAASPGSRSTRRSSARDSVQPSFATTSTNRFSPASTSTTMAWRFSPVSTASS